MFSEMAPRVTDAHVSDNLPELISRTKVMITSASFLDMHPLSHQRSLKLSRGWMAVANVMVMILLLEGILDPAPILTDTPPFTLV